MPEKERTDARKRVCRHIKKATPQKRLRSGRILKIAFYLRKDIFFFRVQRGT